MIKNIKLENWSIDQLINDYKDRINLNPPYQRKFCWPQKYQTELIETIIDGDTINAIRLVETSRDKFVALDGKQRLTTIFRFMNSDFPIEVPLTDNHGHSKKVKFTFKKIEEIASNKNHKYNTAAFALLRKIKNHRIECAIYDNMSLDKQLIRFNRINFSKELKQQEKEFSKYFYAKIFLEYLCKHFCFKILAQKSKYQNDNRSRDLVWALRLFYVIWGYEGLSSGKPLPNLDRLLNSSIKEGSYINKFIISLNDKIKKYVDDNKDEMNDNIEDPEEIIKMIEKFNWLDSLKDIKRYLDIIGNDFFKDKVNAWTLIYYPAFIMTKVYVDKSVTYNSFIQDQYMHKSMAIDYLKWVVVTPDKTRRQAQKNHFNDHKNQLNNLFLALNLDKGIKKKYIPQHARDFAKLESNGKCSVCEAELTLDNIQIDHVQPSSLFSTTNYKAVCKVCNRQGSDNTPATLERLLSYKNKAIG